MKNKTIFATFILLILHVLVACNAAGGEEPVAEFSEQSETINEAVVEKPITEKISIESCTKATADTHQLIDAAQGICFLYPNNYDVFQGEDGSLTLYVKSLMNTDAPLATVRFASLNGRSVQEVVPDYPSDADLATMSFLSIDLGDETATVFDNLPGQDINRRIITVHDNKVYDLMIARIGAEYGVVGAAAEALYATIIDSWQFISIEPDAPLLAGPECPEPQEGTTLYTNEVVGYCLLLPDAYAIHETNPDVNNNEMAFYIGSLQDVSHAKLFISVTEANGGSLEEIMSAKEAEITEIMGTPAIWSFGYMLDGVPANQFDQVPGQDLSRQVIFVHNDRLYTLTFVPDEAAVGDAYLEMQTLYDMVMDTFSFR